MKPRWMVVAFLVVALAGFGPSYAAKRLVLAPLGPWLQVHVALFAGWLVLLLAQTRLVAATALFRRSPVAGIAHDLRSRGRPHPAYVLGGLVLLISGPARFALAQTSSWHAIARTLIEHTPTLAQGDREPPAAEDLNARLQERVSFTAPHR